MSSSPAPSTAPQLPAPAKREQTESTTDKHTKPLGRRMWYAFLQSVLKLAGLTLFRVRSFGHGLVPPSGPVLLLSNHQSHLDPMLLGMTCPRQLNYLARQTLFEIRWLAWLIRSLNAIPLDREGIGLGGLKETMRRLKHADIVVLFPEGTRSRDGAVHALKPGFCTLARRCHVTIVPVGIAGAYESWPRGAKFPIPRPVTIVYGQPISPEQIAAIPDDNGLVHRVEQAIRHCHAQAQAQLRIALGS